MISHDEYSRKRDRLADAVRALGAAEPVTLQKSTSNLFRHRAHSRGTGLDVRDFNHVIRVDEHARYADVEGMTTYEDLVRETLPFGLMPAVVPELKSITVGGAATGVGIESSSFRYGFVHETIREVEVLLADGSVVSAAPDNDHRDLLLGFPNSYGTLGYALKLTVALVPVKPYVKIRHERFSDVQTFCHALDRVCREKRVDFVDGVLFAPNECYVTTGEFVDRAEWVSDYTGQHIYYQSIRRKEIDYLTIHDYIWRWDTDWFWCSKHFGVQHPVIRRLWGKKRLRSTVYWKLRKRYAESRLAQALTSVFTRPQEAVIQDVEVPIEHAPEFVRFFQDEIKIAPVWVCPVTSYDPSVSYPLYPMDPKTLYLNFGFWDVVPTDREEGYYNRKIEAKVQDLQGKKSLYSSSYYSRDEFWRIYNEKEYRKLKARYDPGSRFKDLYDKCVLKK